jgi:hypothetical protein
MHRRWLAAVSALTLALPLMAMSSPASAATRTGVRLSTGTTAAFPRGLPPVAASPSWAVYQVFDIGMWPDRFWTDRAISTSTGNTRAVHLPQQVRPTIASDIVAGTNGATNTVYWDDLAAGTSGHRALHGISSSDKKRVFVTASPDGWLSLVKDSAGAWHLFDTVAATGVSTEHTSWNRHGLNMTNWLAGQPSVATGPDGFVLTDGTIAVYTTYIDAAPVTLDATDASNTYDISQCFGASSNAVGCLGQDTTNFDQWTIRLSLTGGAAVAVKADPNGCPESVYVTDSETGWHDYCTSPKLYVQPAAGGTPSTTSYDVGQLASVGGAFVFDTSRGSGKAPGLWKAVDAATAPVQLLSAGPSSVMDDDVALAPGRVAFGDDSTVHYPVFSRTLSTSGSVSTGSKQLIASRATNTGLSISGQVTAYDTATDVYHQTLHVTGLGHSVALGLDRATGPIEVSGTRVLYFVGATNSMGLGSPRLYDLRTHTDAPVKGVVSNGSGNTVDLFGNYLALLKSDGTVWRRDLSTGKDTKIAAPVPKGQSFGGSVYTYGSYVGWRIFFCGPSSCGHSYAFRNVRTMAAPVHISGSETTILAGLTSDGALVAVHADRNPHWVLRRYGSATTVDLTSDAGFAGIRVNQSRLAWIDGHGLARVAALPHAPDPPVYLGNGVAHHTFTTGSGRLWKTYLPTSASLSRCTVVIRSTAGVVRRLTCTTGGRRLGDGIVSWGGRDATGHLVPAGSYSWRLVARNADGTLRLPNGSIGQVGGVVVVKHG